MAMLQVEPAVRREATPPRSRGTLTLTTKRAGAASAIDRLRLSGASKAAFPRRTDAVEAIVINTSGGLTGGDRFSADLRAGEASRLVATTQAAERAYLSAGGAAKVSTRLAAEAGATLHWLPQELILFDGSALDRRLSADLADDAEFLMVEPVLFGRGAMGETLRRGRFRDRVEIRRAGRPLYLDGVDLAGDIERRLLRPAVAAGGRAMASIVFVARRAEALLGAVRRLLPEAAGASLLRPDLLVLRLVLPDGFLLRRALVPVLSVLSGAPLPKSWNL